jgi:hypothetical protein
MPVSITTFLLPTIVLISFVRFLNITLSKGEEKKWREVVQIYIHKKLICSWETLIKQEAEAKAKAEEKEEV